MRMTLNPSLRLALRLAIAVALIAATGFWGFVITFSNYPPTWSRVMWLAYIVAWHVPSALLIGFVLPTRWYLALATAWGAAITLLAVPSVLAPLLISVLGFGYLGSLVARWSDRGAPAEGSGRNVGWLQWLFTIQAGIGGFVTALRVLSDLAPVSAFLGGAMLLIVFLSGISSCLFIASAVALWFGWRHGAILAASALVFSLVLHTVYLVLGSNLDPDRFLTGKVWLAVVFNCLWLLYFTQSSEVRRYYGPVTFGRFLELFGRRPRSL